MAGSRLFAGRKARNVPDYSAESEGPAEHIRNALTILIHSPKYEGEKRYSMDLSDLSAIKQRLELALHQIESGVVIPGVAGAPRKGYHRRNNPVLAVLGNPLAHKPVGSLRATWGQLEYIRPDDPDGKNIVRVHEFKDGFYATGLDDGSVHLWRRDGKALFVMQ